MHHILRTPHQLLKHWACFFWSQAKLLIKNCLGCNHCPQDGLAQEGGRGRGMINTQRVSGSRGCRAVMTNTLSNCDSTLCGPHYVLGGSQWQVNSVHRQSYKEDDGGAPEDRPCLRQMAHMRLITLLPTEASSSSSWSPDSKELKQQGDGNL